MLWERTWCIIYIATSFIVCTQIIGFGKITITLIIFLQQQKKEYSSQSEWHHNKLLLSYCIHHLPYQINYYKLANFTSMQNQHGVISFFHEFHLSLVYSILLCFSCSFLSYSPSHLYFHCFGSVRGAWSGMSRGCVAGLWGVVAIGLLLNVEGLAGSLATKIRSSWHKQCDNNNVNSYAAFLTTHKYIIVIK